MTPVLQTEDISTKGFSTNALQYQGFSIKIKKVSEVNGKANTYRIKFYQRIQGSIRCASQAQKIIVKIRLDFIIIQFVLSSLALVIKFKGLNLLLDIWEATIIAKMVELRRHTNLLLENLDIVMSSS